MAERIEDRRDQDKGVYAISVVAALVGTGQQNIRLYERKGLLTPGARPEERASTANRTS
jgi:hypothetical protein